MRLIVCRDRSEACAPLGKRAATLFLGSAGLRPVAADVPSVHRPTSSVLHVLSPRIPNPRVILTCRMIGNPVQLVILSGAPLGRASRRAEALRDSAGEDCGRRN
jgi:hypothetical protein